MPTQVNAMLTAVNGADAGTGGRDDWDAPVAASSPASAATGPVKWTGSADAYYGERIQRVPDGAGGVNIIAIRRLIVDSAIARAAGIDTDDVVTFTNPAGVVVHARAAAIRVAELDGVSAGLQTTRLDLEPR
jgi:hypothetical protein